MNGRQRASCRGFTGQAKLKAKPPIPLYPRITSDGGLLAYGELDDAVGLMDMAAAALLDGALPYAPNRGILAMESGAIWETLVHAK